MKIILTGIQPSGELHLGNYFGAMRPAIELQGQGQAVYFIADYHALTSVTKADDLRRYTFDVAAGFLACGLDPARTILFRQSDVPQVHELAWLLSVVTPMGLLERAHSYKDKVAQGAETSHGLFAYPVLMAAEFCSTTRISFRWARTRSSISRSRATSRRNSTTALGRSSNCRSR